MTLGSSRQIFEKYSNSTKIRPVGEPSCSMWMGRQADIHDEADSHFSQFCQLA